MNTGAPTKLITYEDSLTMPENKLEEIVHGESRIMPPPTRRHAFVIQTLARILAMQLDRREYFVLCTEVGLGIERAPFTYRIPDLMVIRVAALRRDRLETGDADPYIWAVPELVVECLSPSNRKGAVQELMADYERIAVPEVWLLDPAMRQFTSYCFESGSLRQGETKQDGQVTSFLLPTMTVELADLWAAFEGVI
ncbi:MAG: Uma2 family endonuclease [Bryobacteraceae bacterium]